MRPRLFLMFDHQFALANSKIWLTSRWHFLLESALIQSSSVGYILTPCMLLVFACMRASVQQFNQPHSCMVEVKLRSCMAVQVIKVVNEAFRSLASAAAAANRPCLVLDIQTPKDR